MSREINLASVASKIGSGSTPRGGESSYLSEGIPFIRSQNVQFGRLEMANVAFIGEDVHHKMSGTQVRPNDVLLNITGASIGRSTVVPDTLLEANVNQHVCIIRINKDKYNPKFLSEFLNSKKGQYLIDSAQSGGSRQGINFQEVGGLKIPDIEYNKQEKIIEILSDFDKSISYLQQEKKYVLKTLEFLMKKIFRPYVCGSRVEKQSFPISTLGDLFQERSETGQINLPLVSITMQRGVIPRDEVGRKDSSSEDKSKYRRILPGDIGYNTMRMWQGVSGLSSIEGIVSPAYTICIPNTQKINPHWAAYLFKEKRMIYKFLSFSQGLVNDTLGLKFPVFSEIKIRIPDLAKQYADVEYIKSIRKNEILLNRQIKAMFQQKRGLMQKLLSGNLKMKEVV